MTGFANRVLACAVASALALAGCSSIATRANAPATTPPTSVPSTTTTTVRPRTYGVGTREATYVDTSRPTSKNNTYPGAPSRTIRVRFYYPTLGGAPAIAGGPFPVVLFSHGHNGLPEGYAALLGDLARAGYVVVAPAAASTTKTWPRNFLDAGRIGVAGHSLGGLTTYGLVYNPCCVDRRMKAAVVLAGAGLGALPPGESTNIRTPLLAIHGDQDRTIPIATGRDSFQHANRPKFFLTIVGGSHSGEARGGTTPGQRVLTRSMIAFFDYYLRGVGTLGTLRKAATKPGLTTFDAKP